MVNSSCWEKFRSSFAYSFSAKEKHFIASNDYNEYLFYFIITGTISLLLPLTEFLDKFLKKHVLMKRNFIPHEATEHNLT